MRSMLGIRFGTLAEHMRSPSGHGAAGVVVLLVVSAILGGVSSSCRCSENGVLPGGAALRIGQMSNELEVLDVEGEPFDLEVDLDEMVRREVTKAGVLTIVEEGSPVEETSRLRVRARVASDGATGKVHAMVQGRLDRGVLIPLSWEVDLVRAPSKSGNTDRRIYREALSSAIAKVIVALGQQVEVARGDIEAQVAALDRSEPAAKVAAAKVLGQQRHRPAIDAICRLLSAEERPVVEAGAAALAKIGDTDAAACLIEAGGSEDWRLEARVDALGELGGAKAREFLEATASEGPSNHIKRLAADGARRIRGDDARSLAKGHDHHEEHESSPSVGYIKALKHEEREVRVGAARTLAKMGRHEAIEPLCDLLDHSDVETAAAAFDALVEIGDEGVVPCLLGWADTRETRLVLVIEALGEIGGTNAVSALDLMARDHASPAIRRQARAALERIRSEGRPGASKMRYRP